MEQSYTRALLSPVSITFPPEYFQIKQPSWSASLPLPPQCLRQSGDKSAWRAYPAEVTEQAVAWPIAGKGLGGASESWRVRSAWGPHLFLRTWDFPNTVSV